MTTARVTKIIKLVDSLRRADFVEACRLTAQIDDDAEYDDLLKARPGMANYDGKANYVGAVSHENGWTP